jgi:hypothetical protein
MPRSKKSRGSIQDLAAFATARCEMLQDRRADAGRPILSGLL